MKVIYNPKYERIIMKLKIAREAAGLKQDVVAKKLNKYASYISKIEAGDRRLDILEMIELAEVYKKDIKWFLK